MQHKGVLGGNSQGLAEETLGQLIVVGQSVLQPYVEEGQMAALHQLRGREVSHHGLVVFVLSSK